jgi:hypothetical protein
MVAMTMVILTGLLPGSILGQPLWLDRSHDKTIALEILKPSFDDRTFIKNTKFVTSALFLSLRLPLSENLHFVGELPFANGGFDFDGESESESTIGNPYLGLEISGQNSPVFAELGIRAPLAKEENFGTLIGVLTDFVDRAEAFTPDMVSITAMANYRYKNPSGFVTRLRGGPAFWVNTDKQEFEDDTELFLLYSMQAGYESEQVSIGGGFTGRWLLTEKDLTFGEQTFHQLAFAASAGLGNLRPGIQIRLPLDDDFKEVVDFVFGVNLGIQLK